MILSNELQSKNVIEKNSDRFSLNLNLFFIFELTDQALHILYPLFQPILALNVL